MLEGGNMWVDNSGEKNRLYNLVPQGNNVYRIAPGTGNPEWNNLAFPDVYVGSVDAHTAGANTRLFWNISPETAGAQLDWIFVSVDEYKAKFDEYTGAWSAYDSLVNVYNVAQALKVKLDAAKAKGVDVAAQESVYLNEGSTVEELNAAVDFVAEVLAKIEEQEVDPMNPVDKTSTIVNPTMENTSGWTTIDGVQNRATHTNVVSGAYTEETIPAFEHWNNGAYTGKFYQVITGLPNGLYRLKAAVMGDQDPAAEGTGLYLYANDCKTPVTSNIPAYYTVFAEVTDGTIEIGWTAEIKHSQWISSDTYSLLYYGNRGEATYAGAVAGLVNAELNKFDGREAEMSVGTIDTYKATLNGLIAADLAGVNAAIATIANAAAAVQTNIDGWLKYADLIVKGNEVRTDNSFSSSPEMSAMAAYVARQAPSILKAKALSPEELLAEVAKFEKMIDDAIRNSLQVNSDVTDMFLVNPGFENGATGWSGSWGAINGSSTNKCMEAYERDWDAYQIVKDAPQGVYEVSLQAFYRVKRAQESYDMYVNGEQTCPGHVYVNNHLNEVKCVFEEPVRQGDGYIFEAVGTGPETNPNVFVDAETGDSVFFANDMKTAAEAFAAGMYEVKANGLVAQKGEELRMGVKGKKQTATWVAWDNIKMIYRGKQIEYTMPYLKQAIADATTTLNKQAMARDTKALLEAAMANAEKMVSSTNEEAVFSALVQIYAAQDSVNASADLFAELTAKADELQNAVTIYGATATEDAMSAATELLIEMLMGVEGSSLTKEEAKALLSKVGKVLADLMRPVGGSDDAPADYSAFIQSAGFENETGAGSTAGWTGTDGGALGNGAYEFFEKKFDLYQDINYLTNGTYRLEVSAFERMGASTDDYKSYVAGKDTATVYIYGMSGGVVYQDAISRLASGAITSNDAYGVAGCTKVDSLQNQEVGADSLIWVPNNMASGAAFFNDFGSYSNAIYVEVVDGTLRIGIKKEVQGSNDWVMMDNWRLYYLGTASVNKPDAIEGVLVGSDTPIVKREIYTLGGAKVNKLTSGIYIIRNIHSDGTVTVKKVIK